jgi:hypothetical protein
LWSYAQRTTLQTFAEEHMPEIVRFIRGFEGDNWDDNVMNYRVNANVETGYSQNHAVHVHATIVIRHNSRLHLDPAAIRRLFLLYWNRLATNARHKRTSLYVNIRAGSDNLANVMDYQEKDLLIE